MQDRVRHQMQLETTLQAVLDKIQLNDFSPRVTGETLAGGTKVDNGVRRFVVN